MRNETQIAIAIGVVACIITWYATTKSRDNMWVEAAFRNGVATHDTGGGMSWKKPCTHKDK